MSVRGTGLRLALALLVASAADGADWQRHAEEREAVIVTSDADAGPRETTIWFVFVEDVLYVRAVRVARWGRNLADRPEAVIRLSDTPYAVRGTPIEDAAEIQAVRDAVQQKYPDSNWWARAMRAMLGGIEVFRLDPAADDG